MRDLAAVRFRQKTTAPVIGAESFRMSARPNFHAAIANHCQFHALAVYFAERVAEIVCGTTGPIEKNIDANELFLSSLSIRSGDVRLLALAVLPSLQNLR